MLKARLHLMRQRDWPVLEEVCVVVVVVVVVLGVVGRDLLMVRL